MAHAVTKKTVFGGLSLASSIVTAIVAKNQANKDWNNELFKKMILGRSLYKKWQENPNLTLLELSQLGKEPKYPKLEKCSIFIEGHSRTLTYTAATFFLFGFGLKLLTAK